MLEERPDPPDLSREADKFAKWLGNVVEET